MTFIESFIRNKRTKISLAGVLCLCCSIGLSLAKPVNITMVRKVAQVHIETHRELYQRIDTQTSTAKSKDYSISEINYLRNDNRPRIIAYVVNLSPRGYIVISPDTDVKPVIGYSFRSNFIIEEFRDNAALHIVKGYMEGILGELEEISREVCEENNSLWHSCLTGDENFMSRFKGMEVYGPLMDTHWAQDDPFNRSCPKDPDTGERCVTGCVATALAQVLNYYEYPRSIIFTEEDNYQATFTDIPINIYAPDASIENIDYNGSGVHPTTETLANLMFACGVLVNMQYSSEGSGANIFAATYMDELGYESAEDIIVGLSPGYASKMKNTILDSKLLHMGVYMPGVGGHSGVCDGYNSTTDEYHLNFGWGGYMDGWYTTATMTSYGVVATVSDITPGESAIDELSGGAEQVLSVYPSPFSHSVRIEAPTADAIIIFDTQGRIVYELHDEALHYEPITWTPGDDITSGVYLLKTINNGRSHETDKLIYIE